MKELFKRIRINAVINAVLTVFVGILFIVNPYAAGTTLAVLIGIAILCSGIIDIIRFFSAREAAYFLQGSLFAGVIKAVIGIFLFTHTDKMLELFAYIFSVIIIVNGINCLQGAIQLRQVKVRGWMIHMILSAAIIAGGIIMFFTPFSTAVTAIVIAGYFLIIDGVTELVTVIRVRKVGKEFVRSAKQFYDELEGDIIDMDDYTK